MSSRDPVVVKLVLRPPQDAELLALVEHYARGRRTTALLSMLKKGMAAHLESEGLALVRRPVSGEVVILPKSAMAVIEAASVSPAARAPGEKKKKRGVMSWERA